MASNLLPLNSMAKILNIIIKDHESLTLDLTNQSAANFELEIVTNLEPAQNTSLQGLYQSGEGICTQCEAEGFRQITYMLDRPDVLARYTTKITADKTKYPYLLSMVTALQVVN